MKTRSILVFFLINFCGSLFAQSDSSSVSKKIIYFNNFLAGGLVGESEQGTGFTFSTIHGIRRKHLAFGVGVGFDSYLDWKTLPLFGSISFDFGKVKENAFFIQFNAGYSNAWRIAKQEDWEPKYNVYGGATVSSIIGYRIKTNRFSLYISAGHKFQRVDFSYNPTPWLTGQTESKISIDERINRIMIQIGFGLH
jgi:hypothetical protein